MIGVFSYTVILTYLALGTGVTGIYFAANNKPVYAVICLIVAGLFDMFDGAVARTKKNRTDMEKGFGIQIDSLSDLVCFGVLPAAIGIASGMDEWYFIFILAIYVLCGLIRLAYFNVTEEERQKATSEKRKYYEGLPITNAALIFACVFTFSNFFKTHDAFALFYAGIMVLVSFLFVFKVKIPKFGKIGMTALIIIGTIIFVFLCFNMNDLIDFWHIDVLNF